MKTLVLLFSLLASAPDFDLKEPITLDLKDAKATEVITLLGALAHLPVSIAPEVTGTVTIKLQDVPFDRALERISAPLDFTLKVEGGKLVAAPRTHRASPEARAVAAVAAIPANAPRLAVESYSRAFKGLPPLSFRLRDNGIEGCSRVRFDNGATTYGVSAPGSSSGFYVSQFGWEPVTRSRLIAIDGPDSLRAVALGESPLPRPLSFSESISLLARPRAGEDCSDAAPRVSREEPMSITLIIEEKRDGGGQALIARPRLRVQPGSPFTFRSGLPDAEGQSREVVVFGYLSAGRRLVTATLVATAIRTDPADGREYVYAQIAGEETGGPFSSIPMSSAPTPDGVPVASLPAGVAAVHPLELSISLSQ